MLLQLARSASCMVEEEMLFNLPEVLTSMYNGMCLTPPRFSMVPDHMSQDIVDDATIYANWEPLHLWTFSL